MKNKVVANITNLLLILKDNSFLTQEDVQVISKELHERIKKEREEQEYVMKEVGCYETSRDYLGVDIQ